VERQRREEGPQQRRGEEVRVGLEVGEHAVEGSWRRRKEWGEAGGGSRSAAAPPTRERASSVGSGNRG
jgi:hypothetical protein